MPSWDICYECRGNFNRLLDELEPLPPSAIDGDITEDESDPKADERLGRMVQGADFEDDEEDVPDCPPPSDDEEEYTPSFSGEAEVAPGMALSCDAWEI